MCVWSVPHHTCGDPKTACGNSLSLPTMWVLGIQTQVIRLDSKYLYLLSHLASPKFTHFFSNCPRTHSVDETWPWTHNNPPASASRVLGLKVCATPAQFSPKFLNSIKEIILILILIFLCVCMYVRNLKIDCRGGWRDFLVVTALLEDLGSIPSNHMAVHSCL